MNSNQIMGKAIKDIRIKKGLTENYVAAKSKLPLWKYKSIEEGEYIIGLDILEKVSDALFVSKLEIVSSLEDTEPDKNLPAEIKDLLNDYYFNRHLFNKK